MKQFVVALIFLLAACSKAQTTDVVKPSFAVENRGAMREMFAQGNIGANISLVEFGSNYSSDVQIMTRVFSSFDFLISRLSAAVFRPR